MILRATARAKRVLAIVILSVRNNPVPNQAQVRDYGFSPHDSA